MVGRETVPDVTNFSCWTPTFQHPTVPSAADIVKAVFSSLLGLIVIIVNSIFIVALNGRRYAKHLTFQPRYLLTSMALADLLKGLLAVPLSIYPALYHCWPYPAILCGIQALLMPLLHHQVAVALSLLALDRYYCLLHPGSYRYRASRLLCLTAVLLAWMAVGVFHVCLYLPTPHFYFNHFGSQTCEPFQTANSKIIMVACAVYFPTTMVTMYCYGTVFHVARTSVHRLVCATVSAPEILGGPAVEKLLMSERRESLRACRVMAVVSLSFVITITPWTLRQIIAACTNSRIPGGLDYAVWVVNIFGGTVIIFIYWLLSPTFRRALDETLHNRICCGNVYYDRGDDDDVTMVHLPLQKEDHHHQQFQHHHHHHHHHYVPSSKHDSFRLNNGGHAANCPAVPPPPRINSSSSNSCKRPATQSCNTTPRHLANGRAGGVTSGHHNGAYDIEALGEKYWGEILERTVSSTSLQNLQRIYRNNSTSHPELRLSHTSNWHI